jgi:mRNA interferase RelE/StbE
VYEVAYSKQALNALRKLPRNEARRIRVRIADYAAQPTVHAHHVKKLKGRAGLRLRIGKWRVLFEVNGNILSILEIGSRGSIYG